MLEILRKTSFSPKDSMSMSKNTTPATGDDAKLAATRHLFPEKRLTPLVEAHRSFELFIIRLGKDAEFLLLCTNEHVTALQEIDSGYFSRQQVPLEGRS
jgi:hypothetical protein